MALLSITITILGSSGGTAGAVAGARAMRRRGQADDAEQQRRFRARRARGGGITEGAVRGGITGIVQALLGVVDWGGRHASRGVNAVNSARRRVAPHARAAISKGAAGAGWVKRWAGDRLRDRREARLLQAANSVPELTGDGPVKVTEHVRDGHIVRSHSRGAPTTGGMGVAGWLRDGMRR